ncbi:MAG: hypothetical protein KBF71_06890, partial [Alphaproteobacteria bacterium]|nr:hypothetical protein [Alphaproteobacteria bacterium]
QEILDMFYQHFRPLSLIGLVRTYLNKVLALPKSTAYTHLSEAFQDVLDDCTDPWQIDTDKVYVELTDEAVLKILMKVGVLTSL